MENVTSSRITIEFFAITIHGCFFVTWRLAFARLEARKMYDAVIGQLRSKVNKQYSDADYEKHGNVGLSL